MGYRGELLIIFKCRTNVSIFNSLHVIKDMIADLNCEPNLYSSLSEGLTELNKEIDRINKGLDFPYNVGDRIGQLLIRRKENIIWNLVSTKEELGTTERGDGGFGSTNVQKK